MLNNQRIDLFQMVLLEGLTAVDKAQEWYLKQISVVQDKIKHLGRMGSHVVIFAYATFLYCFLYNTLLFIGTMV